MHPELAWIFYLNEFNYLSYYYLWLNKHHNTHYTHSTLAMRISKHTEEEGWRRSQRSATFEPLNSFPRNIWILRMWTWAWSKWVRCIYNPFRFPSNSRNLRHNLIFQFNFINCLTETYREKEARFCYHKMLLIYLKKKLKAKQKRPEWSRCKFAQKDKRMSKLEQLQKGQKIRRVSWKFVNPPLNRPFWSISTFLFRSSAFGPEFHWHWHCQNKIYWWWYTN